MRPQSAFLIVEKGTPFEKGTRVALQDNSLLVGRAASSILPDVGFDNFLISRKHCMVECSTEKWSVRDLNSKHGTTLNGSRLEPERAYPLRNGDRVGLAENAALLRYIETWEFEKTIDLSSTQPQRGMRGKSLVEPVAADLAKMELVVDGTPVPLSVKEWNLFALLYQHRNKVVDYGAIRSAVWPERNWDNSQIPDVGVEEVNVLIYRVRKKLGDHGKALRTVRGRGCILEL